MKGWVAVGVKRAAWCVFAYYLMTGKLVSSPGPAEAILLESWGPLDMRRQDLSTRRIRAEEDEERWEMGMMTEAVEGLEQGLLSTSPCWRDG